MGYYIESIAAFVILTLLYIYISETRRGNYGRKKSHACY